MKKVKLVVVLFLTGMLMVSCSGVDACDCAQLAKDASVDFLAGMSEAELEKKYKDTDDFKECEELSKDEDFEKEMEECFKTLSE
jgi:hypothetical protein